MSAHVASGTSTSLLIESGLLEIGDGYRAKNTELAETGIPFARAQNLNHGFDFSDADLYPEADLSKVGSKVSRVGDCVFTSKGSVGRVGYVTPWTPPFVYSPQLSYWRSLDWGVIDPQYLRYWLLGPEFCVQRDSVKGSTDMADYVNLRDQRRMSITLPPITIQRKIAALLSAYDDLIENNNRRIKLLEEMAQRIYREWFVDFRYPGHENVPLMESELGPIPQGWIVRTLGDVCSLMQAGGTPSRTNDLYWTDGSVQWFKTTELQDGFLKESLERVSAAAVADRKTRVFPPGSILMAIYGSPTVGRLGVLTAEGACNQAALAMIGREVRIAFVCSMWTTGFDVKSLSTVYLDKPLRNHTLMQTITRANRVFPAKNNGLIVAYVDVFKNLQKALAIYAVGGKAGDMPVEEKGALVEALREAVNDLRRFCGARDVELDELGKLKGFDLVAAGKRTVEMLMVDDDEKIAFLSRTSLVNRLYKAILPDTRANEFSRIRAVTKFLADGISEYTERPDITGVLGRVEQLLDESVAANEYLIPDADAEALFDLGAVDWAGLEAAFRQGRPRTAAQRLRSLLSAQISALVRLNPMRVDLVERFEKLVADYNAGSVNAETFFQQLLEFKATLSEEEARAHAELLTEEQLAIFDLLMRPAPELSDAEKIQVKKVAEELLTTLKRDKIVLDWRKEQSTRAAVRVAVEETLDRLPEKFSRQIYAQKCDAVYQHVFDAYWDDGHSVYDRVA